MALSRMFPITTQVYYPSATPRQVVVIYGQQFRWSRSMNIEQWLFDAGLNPHQSKQQAHRLAERYSAFGTLENVELAETIFGGVIKVLTKDPRFRTLNPFKIYALTHSMMDDFVASFQETGNCLSWNPSIEATLVRITE
jgi:hypothetical protein